MCRVFLLLFIVFSVNQKLKAQTGYFGKYNSIELSVNAAPSIKKRRVLKSNAEIDYIKTKFRIFNSTYAIKYNRIINNKISLYLGFERGAMKSFNGSIIYNAPIDETQPNKELVITDKYLEPVITYSGVTLGINFFGFEGINPIGIRGGFSFEYGTLKSDYSAMTVFYTSYFDPNTYQNTYNESIREINYNDLISNKLSVFSMRLNIGKNIIITRKLLLKIDGSIKLLNHYKDNSFQLERIVDAIGNGLTFGYKGQYTYDLTGTSFDKLEFENYRRTFNAYKRLVLSVGLCYAF